MSNCAAGDLARIVTTEPYFRVNLQKIVHVDYACPHGKGGHWHCTGLQPLLVLAWDHPVLMPAGENDLCMPDSMLRPLHRGDGEDETFKWKAKPKPAPAVRPSLATTDERIVLLPR